MFKSINYTTYASLWTVLRVNNIYSLEMTTLQSSINVPREWTKWWCVDGIIFTHE
jgi:hypothetical protein